MHSEWNELHGFSWVGCFHTRVERRGSGGVGCEGSAAGFLADVAGRSGITDTGLEVEPSEMLTLVLLTTAGAGTGVEAVGAGDGCSSGVCPREFAGLWASAYGPVGLSGTRVGWTAVTCVLSSSSGAGMR